MLLQFNVENFKSIKNEVVLSLEASADHDHPNNVTLIEKNHVLNGALIFGANASGKSNIFLAMTAAVLTIRESNARQVGQPLVHIVPYKFLADAYSVPTRFEFVFIAESKRYVYGFSATNQRIVSEYLYVYNTAKASKVFERQGDEYSFTSVYEKSLKPYVERNTSNKLFLATATAWNCKETRVPLMWFVSGINTYSNNFADVLHLTGPMFANDEDHSLKRFTTNLLQKADINISDYELETMNESKEQFLNSLPEQLRPAFSGFDNLSNLAVKIKTIHNVDVSGEERPFSLDFSEESLGTRSLFFLSPILKKAFETGEVVCIDEFDASLHPLLVIYIVDLFNNPEINKNHSQLIVSTQTTELLDLNIVRRDQVYFVDKKNSTGISELYSLDEFSERKRTDVRKAYLLGRYDAIPDIK